MYLSQDDLREPGALNFRAIIDADQLAADIRRLESCWGMPKGSDGRIGREDWLLAWRNVRGLASRLLGSLDPDGRCDPETWHHLLMMVGNFKRQAGNIHPPITLDASPTTQVIECLVLPGGEDKLECDVIESWSLLSKVPGLGLRGGLSTASCLLAALWPESHVIMDVRDRRAAVGLRVGRWSSGDRRVNTAAIPSDEWWFYEWFRRTVAATARAAGTTMTEVERALFALHGSVAPKLSDAWERTGTWSEYYEIAIDQVGR